MKRLRYISRFAQALTPEQVSDIAESSARRNSEDGITGMLIASGELFFQLIEGPDEAIDDVIGRILGDPRHRNVLILGSEQGELRRLCPDWDMKKLDLTLETSDRSELAKSMLRSAFDVHGVLDNLVDTLEQFTWREFLAAEMAELDPS